MKLPIVFLAVLGLVCGKPLPTGSLKDDVKDFLALFPTEKVLEIALDYLAYDPEVKEFVAYIQSEEFPFPKIHNIVEHLNEYKDCLKFITDEGVDVYSFVSEIHDTLGFHPYQPTNTTHMGVGFYGLVDDVYSVLPLDDWAALLDKKMETGEFFKTIVTTIRSPVLVKMVEKVQAMPEYHELLEILRGKVVYGERIVKLLWEASRRGTQNLRDDLKELMALFPTDDIIQITLDYLANDPKLRKVYANIPYEEFPKIHAIVEHFKEYAYCLKFINDQGVDVYAFISEVYNILDLPPYQPRNTTRNGVGIKGLIDDVIAVLPLDDLKAFYYRKMETREYFKTIVPTIPFPVFVKMVQTVRAWPEYQELLEIVREKDFDVERIFELFRKLYDREFHRLQNDLKEFMELNPTDKVLEIALDYLAYDEEVRKFVVYIQSEKFPRIHKIVEHLKEYKDCSQFYNDQGVDVYAIVKEIHDILGLHPYQPTNATHKGVGFYGLVHDVYAVLPLYEWAALLDKKMETREYFKTVVNTIHSPVLVKMVETVQAMPEYHELLKNLREMVADGKYVIRLLWKLSLRETHTLRDDLKEFMALFPTEDVIQITLDYLAYDPELHEIFAYIQSEEFPKIHAIVEHLKEYAYCLKFINDQGVDVYAFISEVYNILDLPPYQPTNTTRMGVGIYGLIDDVFAVLPLDDFKTYYYLKMETREYFKTVVTTIRPLVRSLKSPGFVKVVETVRAFPEYKKLIETLREKGFDVEHFIEHLRALFGPHPLYKRSVELLLSDHLLEL